MVVIVTVTVTACWLSAGLLCATLWGNFYIIAIGADAEPFLQNQPQSSVAEKEPGDGGVLTYLLHGCGNPYKPGVGVTLPMPAQESGTRPCQTCRT